MVTEILWGDGTSDKIYLTYTAASGSQTIMVSSDANAGPARTKDITFVSSMGNISRVLTVIQETNMDYVSITWNDTCITYNDTAIAYPYEEPYIVFEDPYVEAICVANWGDGTGLKPSQAAQVTATQFGTTFVNNTDITSFDELKYFTSITTVPKFTGCTSLERITFPPLANKTQVDLFSGCVSLERISFDTAIATNYSNVFRGDTLLTRVDIPNIETWMGCSFSSRWDYYQHPFAASGGGHLYINNAEVTNLVIPNGATTIGVNAFRNCVGITSVSFPSTLTGISSDAFSGCTGLSGTFTLPAHITSYGNGILTGCTGITNLEILGDIRNHNILNSGTFCGNGTGTLHIYGSVLASSGTYNNSGFTFKVVMIDGDFSPNNSNRYFFYNTPPEQLIIGGDVQVGTANVTNSYAISFVEIGGIVIGGSSNVLGLANYAVIHLKYNGVAIKPSQMNLGNIGNWRTKHYSIYVDSQAVLDMYAADSDWTSESDYINAIGLWSDYNGQYKE